MLEKVKVIIVLRAQFAFDKLPKTFNEVEVGAVRRDVKQLDMELFGQLLNNLAFLISRIIQYQTDFLFSILRCDTAQQIAYFRSGDIAVICNSQYFLGTIIHSPQDIETLAAREGLDKTTRFAIDTAKEIAPHNKMRRVQKQQRNVAILRLLYQGAEGVPIKFFLLFRVCLSGKRAAFQPSDSVFLKDPQPQNRKPLPETSPQSCPQFAAGYGSYLFLFPQ